MRAPASNRSPQRRGTTAPLGSSTAAPAGVSHSSRSRALFAGAVLAVPALLGMTVPAQAASIFDAAPISDAALISRTTLAAPASLPLENAVEEAPDPGILSTSPAADEKLNPAPSSVSILLSAPPVESSMTVFVKDAKGRQWDVGLPQLDGSSMFQPVDPSAPTGTYRVMWAYTSTSGEYFQGQFSYKVTTGTGDEGTSNVNPTPTAEPSKREAENQAAEAASQAQSQSGQISTLLAVLIGLGVIAVLIVGLSARRRMAADGSQSQKAPEREGGSTAVRRADSDTPQ